MWTPIPRMDRAHHMYNQIYYQNKFPMYNIHSNVFDSIKIYLHKAKSLHQEIQSPMVTKVSYVSYGFLINTIFGYTI